MVWVKGGLANLIKVLVGILVAIVLSGIGTAFGLAVASG